MAVLSEEERKAIDACWRASLYLCVGMLYLQHNPLLKEPLRMEHVKKRLLGHWGTDPGQTFVWVHLNRLIRKHGLNMIYISGPGHGAPAVLANAYLEGTYSEVYPDKGEDEGGMKMFFKQFSFPGGVGSHCTPKTPGSLHEGGELGYSLSHGCGAAFDNPDLIVAVVIGDGEAETGALATSWHINKFLNPDETASNRLSAIYEATRKTWMLETRPEDEDGGFLSPEGRGMEMLSEQTLEGCLEGYVLTGRHGLSDRSKSPGLPTATFM